jgi:hypothetical protein
LGLFCFRWKQLVIAGLDPAIDLFEANALFRWMRGSSPRMTIPNKFDRSSRQGLRARGANQPSRINHRKKS